MGAVALRLRTELRSRWRGWLGLVMLIGIFGGATLATAAGARRTDTAYDRFLAVTHPYDQFLLGGDLGEIGAPITPADIRALPQVAYVLEAAFFSTSDHQDFIASADPRFDRSYNRAIPVEGRLPVRANEIAVPVAIKDRIHARVGRKMTFNFVTMPTGEGPPATEKRTLTVTAIVASAGEFPPESDLGPPRIHLTQAFYRENAGRLGTFPYMLVFFRHGTRDLNAFRRTLSGRFDDKPVIGYAQAPLTKNVDRSFHLQAVSLGLFSAALAVVTALVLGQALGRQALSEGVEYPAMRALGMTRRQLFTLGTIRALILATTGFVLALPLAFLLSPLAPTGLARAAEPTPGFAFDAAALVVGGAIMMIVLVAFAMVPAARAARAAAYADRLEAGGERGSRAAELATRAGASPPAAVGVRLALEPGRGRTAVPVRTTIVGVALAVAAVTLSLGFAASLDHLLHTPRLYGVTWNAIVQFDDDDTTNQRSARAIEVVRSDPDVEAAGYGGQGLPLLVEGVQADAMMLPAEDRTFYPAVQEGRAPLRDGEIVLGPKTLERIHRRVGDTVGVGAVGVPPSVMRVVGRAVLPTVGHTANLGEGALMTFDSIHVFVPGVTPDVLPRDEFEVRFRPGVDESAVRARVTKALAPFGGDVSAPTKPADLLNFGRNGKLPYILSGLLAALALATLAHAIFTAIARRRRDLAILKTIGFTRGETRRAVAWQSSTFVMISLALGILGGAIASRWLWTVYVNSLGIIPEPRVPVAVDLAIVPIGLLVANALALIPGRSAARTRPALVLRTE